mgnify:CR=1 FL=1
MNIWDLVKAEKLVTIWEASTDRPPYIGEMFFPNIRQKGLKLSFIKGKDRAPIALVASNFDANVLYRDRIGVEKVEAQLPFFKEAKKIDEVLRQELLSTTPEYAKFLIDKVFDDETELLIGADATAERMRMQLLANGVIPIAENGVNWQYDYGFSTSTQMVTEDTKWSATGAHPLKSMYARIKAYKKLTGKSAAYIVMSQKIFDDLCQDEDITNYFAKLQVPNLYPADDEIKRYVESRLAVTIFVNDKYYIEARDHTLTKVPFYPEDRYTILPTLDLGNTVYGTTPEEADLISGNSKASSCSVTSNGVAVTTWNEVDPVNVNTKVSQVCLPSCEEIDKIYIVKVL